MDGRWSAVSEGRFWVLLGSLGMATLATLMITQHFLAGIGRWPKTRTRTYSLTELGQVRIQQTRAGQLLTANLVNGEWIALNLKTTPVEAEQVAYRFKQAGNLLPTATAVASDGDPITGTPDHEQIERRTAQADHSALLGQIRSAAFWSLGLGALHFIIPGLSWSWGATLLLVGLASFVLVTPAMVVVNALTFIWVAVLNALSGNVFWIAIGAVQALTAWSSFNRWRLARRQRPAPVAEPDDPRQVRAERLFPWPALIIGVGALGALVLIFASAIVFTVTGGSAQGPFWTIFGFLESFTVNLGVLGFGIGLASLLASFRPKSAAVLGLVAGALAVALELGLFALNAA